MVLKYLIEKEFKMLIRDKFLPKIIIMLPIMVILLLPFAANYDIKDLNIQITDNDNSTASHRLTDKILSGGYFKNASLLPDNYDIYMEIPHNFEKGVVSGTPVEINIAANSINGNKAGLGINYLGSIIKDFITENYAQNISDKNIIGEPSVINRYNPSLNYRIFMVPALMVMLLTVICGFLPALNIVREIEDGTIEQMNVSPVSKFSFIIAKLIPYWVIGLVVLTITMILAFFVHGLIPAGNIGTIYLGTAFFILAISGFGLVISNNSSTMSQAMFVMFFFILIFILLSGLYTPIESMPNWAQTITKFNPLTYYIKIMRGVYLRGATISDITPLLGYLSLFAIFFNTWAILSYRKKS